MGDRGCNLECVKNDKGGDNTIEFVGPVKIILVDQPKSAYVCKKCYAAMIVLAQMMMAMTTIIVMFYSISYKKGACFKALHIFLCTVGLQVIIPSGVLSLNNLNGSSSPMKPSDRKSEHIFLQCFGLACAIAGIIISFCSDFTCFFTLHSCLEPRGQYCRTVWCAIGIGIAHILIGATVMTIFMYSLSSSDLHAVLCSAAYHFFSAEAILSLNYANGWSAPIRLKHRRFAHVLLQVCAMICAITGTVLVAISKGLSRSVHGITGIAAAILACITFVLGPFALTRGRHFRLLHMSFGIPTFIVSTISLCCGLFTSDFQHWAHSAVAFILIGFIVFYVSFIMVTCFMKCMMKV